MDLIKLDRKNFAPKDEIIGSGKVQVIDNFLPQKLFREVQAYFLSHEPKWTYQDGIVDSYGKESQFVHMVYDEHKVQEEVSWDACSEICEYFDQKPSIFYRIKVNSTEPTKQHYLPNYHIDFYDCITAIFYLTTTNGKTIFYNGNEVECVENRMVIFDSNLEHTGYTSTDKRRVVMNLNYVTSRAYTPKKANNEYNPNNTWND